MNLQPFKLVIVTLLTAYILCLQVEVKLAVTAPNIEDLPNLQKIAFKELYLSIASQQCLVHSNFSYTRMFGRVKVAFKRW